MIHTIVFDIGNVLAHFRWREYLEECGYTEEMKRKIGKATVLSSRWHELDRGVIDETKLIAACGKEEPSVEKEILKLFEDASKIVQEYEYSSELVRRLKANGYRVYLLSNYARFSFAYAKENFEFIKYVDGGVISYEVKCTKPEAKIYHILIEKYGIKPEEAVFLDDLPANLEGAKPFGFKTIQVTSFEQIINDLRALGVRI
ncbi:MAG TPA: HAD family phosphatase [Lachnospiraceae bacterium]|jgi:putative hydrolase of the HAD superfamily|nr:HAD family phosphatase [Lachnospiraceae bacterium]HBY71685.1 HAD family phosphatase [Lachnospiraceae bacterium]HCA70264.1 HAD family phosphatase [Lachnospiraceae bacterium]HCM12241.1 HAD family phosphatase [Lachnospiraceae bacterium]HCR39453.1 HAD family phosphatase [Lachnospiraceae bacterium]